MGNELRSRIEFLRSIGIQIDDARIDSWAAELDGGEGRDLDALWSDILKHVVGSQRRTVANWVETQFGEPIDGARMGRLVDELVSGQRTFEDMRKDIEKATGRTTNTRGEDKKNPDDIKLMGGPHQWYRAGDTWYIAYRAPGNQWVYFEVNEQTMDAVFGEGVRPLNVQAIKSEKDLANRRGYHFGGTEAEIVGDGNFYQDAENAITRSLHDGSLPDWVQGLDADEIMGIIYVGQSQEKSPDWMIEQIAKTKAFQTRYAGISNFRDLGMSWAESVDAYRQYERQLKELHKKRGDGITVTPQMVEKYLTSGHSVDDVAFVYNSFDHLQNNKQAFKAFNDLLVAQGKKPLTAKDQMKFLQGQAPKELYETWEQFSVLHAAREAGIGNYLSAQEAIRLATQTEGIQTTESIHQSMQHAAALALRYRAQIDVSKYGLTADDIIDMSMGLKPRSGRSGAELTQIMAKISAEAEGFLRQGVSPYIGFDPSGRPKAASLGGLRQEGL